MKLTPYKLLPVHKTINCDGEIAPIYTTIQHLFCYTCKFNNAVRFSNLAIQESEVTNYPKTD